VQSVGDERQVAESKFQSLHVDALVGSPFHLRAEYEGIEELTRSIRRQGLLEPLIVRPVNDRYEIVAGNRRFLACKRLGLSRVPCIVRLLTEKESYEVALIENVQRQSLSPLEEAEAFRTYIVNFGWGGISALARRIGKSEEYVSHRVLLLNLPKEILDLLNCGRLTTTHAKQLIWLKEEHQKVLVARMIDDQKLTTRETRNLIKHMDRASDAGQDWPYNLSPCPGVKRSAVTQEALLRHGILMLKSVLYSMDNLVRSAQEMPEMQEFLMQERYQVHSALDRFVKAKVRSARPDI